MANDLSINLCAYWKLDDSATGTAVNSVGSGNLTVYQNPTQGATGLIGSAVQFDSSLSTLYNTSVRPFPGDVSAFSVSLWVYPDVSLSSLGRSWQLIRSGTSPNSFSVQINGASNNTIAGYIYGVDASYVFHNSLTNSIRAQQWNHVVVSWAINTNPSIYANNVNVTNSIQNSRTGFTATPANVNVGLPNLSFNLGNGYQGNNLAGPGRIDEVGIWTRALTAAEVSILYNGGSGFTYPFLEEEPPTPVSDLSTGLQGYWKLDESTGSTLYDSVGVNHLTNSNAVMGSTDSVIGRSVEFDTSTDYIQDLTISGLDATNNAFSISLWAKFNRLARDTGYNMGLIRFQSTDGPGGNNPTASLFMSGSGESYNYLAGYIVNLDGSTYGVETGSSNITFVTNQWYHIVFTYSNDSSRGLIYVNGVNCRGWHNNRIFVNPTLVQPNRYITAGNSYGGARVAIDGKIDEIGYWNRVLTPAEVSTLFNNGSGLTYPFIEEPTPDPSDPYEILSTGLQSYWNLDEISGTTLYDSVGTNNLGLSGVIIGSSDSIINRAVVFDTSTDYLHKQSPTNIDASNNEFTISFWAKYDEMPSTLGYSSSLIRLQSLDGPGGNSPTVYLNSVYSGSNNYITAYTYNQDGSAYAAYTNYGSSSILTTNQWFHIVYTYTNDSSRGIFYLNGQYAKHADNNREFINPTLVQPNRYITVGNSYNGARYGFRGTIDEIGYWNRALTPAEVSLLYNNGNGLAYPFVQPPMPDLSANLVAYWKLDETSGVNTYDSTDNNYDGSIFNSPTLGSTGILGTSYSFTKANSHYIRLGHEETLMGTSDWSFQAWINVNTLSTTFYGIAGFWNGNGTWYLTKWNNDRICCRTGFGGNNIDVLSNDVITTNNWYHIVVTWDRDTSVMMYVNGILQTDMKSISAWSTTSVGGDATHPFHIGQIGNPGSYSGFYFDGRIDEVALWNRLLTQEDVTALYNNGEGLTYPFTGETGPTSPPTVTTSPITDVSIHTATGGGNVTHDGSIALTYRGICWSTSTNPTITDASVQDTNTGEGSYTSYLTNLVSNTTYYVRAWAYNNEGISYGNNVSFTTLSGISAPVVTTNAITDVSLYSATGGGNVIDGGGVTVTARGICWRTSSNPTIFVADGSTSNGSGTGAFTSYLTNLLPGTQYYVRAYAINSQGTSYGNNVQFTTLSRTLLTDLVSYWKLDEADGSVYDSVGTNHGNVIGATMNQPGKINSGVYFDATNEIINCGTASSLRITQAITLSAWIKLPTTQNSYPRIVTKEGAYAMYVSTSNGNLRWFDGTNDIELNSVTNFDLRDNNWHIVTITYDRTSIRGYVDGSLVGAFSYTNALGDVPSIPLTIGNRVAGDRYAIGTIDEVGVWSRALTPAEITQLYNNDKGLSYPFTSTLFNALATYSGFFVTYMGQTVWVFSV